MNNKICPSARVSTNEKLCESSHNFSYERLAKQLQIGKEKTKNIQIAEATAPVFSEAA